MVAHGRRRVRPGAAADPRRARRHLLGVRRLGLCGRAPGHHARGLLGSLKGVILGGLLITLFDRVILTQSTNLVRALGHAVGSSALQAADLTLWRWFFFGLGLVIVMLPKPQGLAGARPIRIVAPRDDGEAGADPLAGPTPATEVGTNAGARWIREPLVAARPDGAPRALLEARGVRKNFDGLVALDGVDLVVPEGAIIGLIGPNGAGKTTLFNCISGLMRISGGELRFRDASIVGLRPNRITARGIARTFQNIRLFANMTVLENVLVGQHVRPARQRAGWRRPAALGAGGGGGGPGARS